MTAEPQNPKTGTRPWSLDDLLSSLESTVSVEHIKLRSKQRVLERAYLRRPPVSRLGVAVMFIAASAAAAGIAEVVQDDFVNSAFDETPPRVVLGTPMPTTEPERGSADSAPSKQRRSSGQRAPSSTSGPSRSDSRRGDASAQLPRRTPSRKAQATPATAVAPAARGSEDPMRVAQALRALRKDGQPQKARSLLEGYLAAHPTGSLAEEALALSIEATHKDDPARAKAFARRYLASYPKGRFRSLARRVLSRSSGR